MSDDGEEFRPRLGRLRSGGGRAARPYLGKVLRDIEKARPGALAKKAGARFSGERFGRGAGIAGAFAARDPFAGMRGRRVAVKIRSVRLGQKGLAKARAHLHYIQRDGAGRDQAGEGAKGRLYGPDRDDADSSAFLDAGRDDRHQFRIILSPEDAGELADLEGFTRSFMAAAERDLGTRLDWVAVNHYDTDHPHVHIVLRGRDEKGGDLVIARNYIAHGFRRRAEELATLELGPRRNLEIARARFLEAGREQWTSLDRDLAALGEEGAFTLGPARSPFEAFRLKLLRRRLRFLEETGLARRDAGGWRLSPRHEQALREAGRRGDIVRSMADALGRNLAPARLRDFATEFEGEGALTGRVAGTCAADGEHERRVFAIEGADGHQWRVEAAPTTGDPPQTGALVEISKTPCDARPSDKVIASIAARHGGVYSEELHRRADPSSSERYRLAHKRRLEALRMAGLVERMQDGSWRIPADYLDRAARHESRLRGARIQVLSRTARRGLPEAGV